MWYTWYKKSPRRSGYDRYENFVARNTLSANAGACLSLKGELAQEHERIDACDGEKFVVYHIRNVWEILYQVYIIFSCLFYIQKFNLEVQFLACHLMVCIKGDRSVILGGYLNRERLSGRI